ESLDRRDQLRERLVERRQRLARARERTGAREHVVLHVGMVDPALLERGDSTSERRVGGLHARGALLAFAERRLERALQELVDALQDRSEGAAREAAVLLVDDAERDEVGRLELEAPVVLARARLLLGEPAVHADHLERLLLEVVGLLGVEGEDLVRHLRL